MWILAKGEISPSLAGTTGIRYLHCDGLVMNTDSEENPDGQ